LLQNTFAVAWKHLHVRLPTDNKGKERNKEAAKENLSHYNIPWETRNMMNGKSVFKTLPPSMLSLVLINIMRACLKISSINDPPFNPEHKKKREDNIVGPSTFYRLLKQVKDASMAATDASLPLILTKNTLTHLQNSGYHNVEMGYHRRRCNELKQRKISVMAGTAADFLFNYPEACGCE
jgi:hypothetical protein